MEQTYMKEKPILPLLLSMALPMVLSMMVNSLYNIIDSYFVAKINENAMTALSLVFPVQNLITAVGVGFGIGINATIAYFLGAQKQEEADTSATLGIACSFLHGVILTIGTITIMPAFLSMFTKEQEILSMGITYSRITFGFSVIISLGVAYEKIFQSVGRMKTTMFCMMSGCILNIILDPIMIFGLGPVPRMGIRGAAWATGLGQLLTLAAYLLFAWIRPLPIRISLKSLKFDLILLKKIYAVGIPATLNMALSSLLISSLNAILAVYGQMYVMILGVYYKLQTFLYLPANGIIQGMRPLIGYNYGAGEQKAAFVYGTLEGMSRELYQMYQTIQNGTGMQIKRMIGSGNGLRKNPVLCEIVEEMFGAKLVLAECEEEAATGAALSSMQQDE